MGKIQAGATKWEYGGQSVSSEEVLLAATEMYAFMCMLNFDEQSCVILKAVDRIPGWPNARVSLQRGLTVVMGRLASPESLRTIRQFVTLSTLPERLTEKKVVSELFYTRAFGWCKASFVRMGDGPLNRVLFIVEDVNEQAGRFERQRELLRENRELRTIIDALMSEYASICSVDLHTAEVDVLRVGGHVQEGILLWGKIPSYALLVSLFIFRVVHEEDRARMREYLMVNNIEEQMGEDGWCSMAYRTVAGGYGEVKVVKVDKDTVLMGFTEQSREIERIHERIYTDSLALVKSRRYYDECLATQRCRALVMADIDNFKEVNDVYGHQCGDAAIATVAATIKSCVRDSDDVVRYGGDEFLVAFHDITEEALKRRTEQIRSSVESIRLDGYPDLRLSMSLGAAFGEGRVCDMLAVADKALYESKKVKNTITILPC